MKTVVRWTAIVYLVAMTFFVWGLATVRYQIFPWAYVYPLEQELSAFVRGHEAENTTLTGKIQSDIGMKPKRQIGTFKKSPTRQYRELKVPDTKSRRAPALVYAQPARQMPGYRFITGTFDFKNFLHGSILLNEKNEIVHYWAADDSALLQKIKAANQEAKAAANGLEYVVRTAQSALNKNPHGSEILRDGSVVYNDSDPGDAIQRISWCGKPVWTTLGIFHHVVQIDEDQNTLWSLDQKGGRGALAQLDLSTGRRLRNISAQQQFDANPDIDIFEIRRNILKDEWLHEPLHPNDVEPLPAHMAPMFPEFGAGDLLISLRSLNLIYVLDPDTLKVKWWRAGQFRRQHDPDWQPNGTITVFDNNIGRLHDAEGRMFSRIWRIEPTSFLSTIVYNGSEDRFYSRVRGKHQLLPNGNMLIASAMQGRVLEVTPEGETVFEFLNNFAGNENLLLSKAIWLPVDFFDFDEFPKCD